MRVAIKEIKTSANALMELHVLMELHHPNIVKYFSHKFLPGDQVLAITMELCDCGTLTEKIKAEAQMIDSKMFKEFVIWRFLSQISSALNYLHSQPCPILHRDLKQGG